MTDKQCASPEIGPEQLDLLARLCEANGVSGDEGAVRAIVLEQSRPFADELRVDTLGNVLALRRGTAPERLRVMVAAHMDEVGLMISAEEGDGFFRFETVGGLQAGQLAGKPVLIGPQRIPGVIGVTPVHLAREDGVLQKVSVESLRIDAGPAGSEVRVGDWAAFAAPFTPLYGEAPGEARPFAVRAKALDDRLGVAILIELLKNAPANIDLLAAFTVQEEVGLRGAQAAAYGLDPDLALVLDCTPAYDFPAPAGDNIAGARYNTRLGAGPAIYVADRGTISDPRLVEHLRAAAETHNIPYQIRQPGGGGTDAGAIHRQRSGIPSVSLSVPGRYLHSANAIARVSDWENTLKLACAALESLGPHTLADER